MLASSIAHLVARGKRCLAAAHRSFVGSQRKRLLLWLVVALFSQSFSQNSGAQFQVNGYVANRGSDNISVINATSQSLTTTVSVGIQPYGVAATPDGRYVYINNHANISVISATTNTLVQTIPLQAPSDNNHFLDAIAASPDGKFVYSAQGNFSGPDGNFLNVISTATNSVVASIPVGEGAQGLAVTPDGKYVYVTNQNSGSVSVTRIL
jgi:YVTN family beta-propeller protein